MTYKIPKSQNAAGQTQHIYQDPITTITSRPPPPLYQDPPTSPLYQDPPPPPLYQDPPTSTPLYQNPHQHPYIKLVFNTSSDIILRSFHKEAFKKLLFISFKNLIEKVKQVGSNLKCLGKKPDVLQLGYKVFL